MRVVIQKGIGLRGQILTCAGCIAMCAYLMILGFAMYHIGKWEYERFVILIIVSAFLFLRLISINTLEFYKKTIKLPVEITLNILLGLIFVVIFVVIWSVWFIVLVTLGLLTIVGFVIIYLLIAPYRLADIFTVRLHLSSTIAFIGLFLGLVGLFLQLVG